MSLKDSKQYACARLATAKAEFSDLLPFEYDTKIQSQQTCLHGTALGLQLLLKNHNFSLTNLVKSEMSQRVYSARLPLLANENRKRAGKIKKKKKRKKQYLVIIISSDLLSFDMNFDLKRLLIFSQKNSQFNFEKRKF